jgi:hypothetical protein
MYKNRIKLFLLLLNKFENLYNSSIDMHIVRMGGSKYFHMVDPRRVHDVKYIVNTLSPLGRIQQTMLQRH